MENGTINFIEKSKENPLLKEPQETNENAEYKIFNHSSSFSRNNRNYEIGLI